MAACLQNTIERFPFCSSWRWGGGGLNPKAETIGALFAFSLMPLCSLRTAFECAAEARRRG